MPKLTTLLAHFQATDNRPQTAREVLDALGGTEASVRAMLGNAANKGLVRREGKKPNTRFYLDENCPVPLHIATPERLASLDDFTRDFCGCWNVLTPFDATRRNPEALRDWVTRLDGWHL